MIYRLLHDRTRLLPAPRALAPAALTLILFITIFLSGQPEGSSSARADDTGISVATSQYLYHPGDKVTFDISLDSGGQKLSGDLLLSVYAPASPAETNPFHGQPRAQLSVRKNYSLTGKDRLEFTASLKDLKAGAGGYPVRVSLVHGGKEQLGGTAWVAVIDPGAHDPLDLVLVWAVTAPPERDPRGEFTGTSLIGRCQATPRTPDTLLQERDIQQKFPGIKTTYAIEPALLEQLGALASGFTLNTSDGVKQYGADSPQAVAAAGCLDSLKQMSGAANVEFLSAPYTYTDLALLAKEGWADGDGQYRIGNDVLQNQLGLAQAPAGAYAPGNDVTTDSLRYLAVTGGQYTVLSGAARMAVKSPPELAGAQTFRLRDISGERITALFAADDASAALLGEKADPAAFFASLANAYDSSGSRLEIVSSPAPDPGLTEQQRNQVYDTLSRESWIRTLTLGEAAQKYRPSAEPATLYRYIDAVSGYISQTYFQKLQEAHGYYEGYRLAVSADEPGMMSLSRKMFTAESGYWTRPDATPGAVNRGLPYLQDITDFTQTEFSRLSIALHLPLLQGSASGEATMDVNNDDSYPVTADIVLEGDNVNFPGGGIQHVTLQPGRAQFKVAYRGSGWTRLKASIQSGGQVIVDDSATIHPISGRAWIVIIVALAALVSGAAYILLVVRRR